jgi:DNA-binding NarL/FixJ family response regulator
MCFGKTHVIFREPASAASSTSTARAPGSPRGIPITETQKRVLVALCRPVYLHHSIPATNPQVALEVHLSVDAVKAHLRLLFDRFGLSELPQNEKRSRLVAIVLDSGLLEAHDF